MNNKKSLQKMSEFIESQAKLQKLLTTQIQPHLQFQELLAKQLQPQQRFQELLAKQLQPHFQFQELISKHLQHQNRFQELLAKQLQPHLRLQELVAKQLQPSLHFQELLAKQLQPQLRLQELLAKQFQSDLMTDSIERFLKPLNNYLSDPLMEKVDVGTDGTITVSGETVDLDEINESIETIANDYSGSKEFLEQFIRFLDKLGSAARVVAICVIFPYLMAIVANLTTPLYEEWWREYRGYDHRTVKKEIIREAQELYCKEELSDFRFVYASMLNVRQSGSMSSEVIGHLYLGQCIKLIEWSKSWSLIEYQDSESRELKMGWVFSRYLKKFI